jgi:hypothetical protein
MFNLLMTAFTALLFVALTPGVLVTLPPKASPIVAALTHGVLFALVYHFTHKAAKHVIGRLKNHEGFVSEYTFPPKINNGQMCAAQTCMCNGAEIAENGRCQ